jgi:hypothetical protein
MIFVFVFPALEELRKPKFVSLSLLLGSGQDFNELETWLKDVNSTVPFSNWTFVLVGKTAEDDYLNNQTRLNLLRSFGRLIPALSHFLVSLDPQVRKEECDREISLWIDKTGSPPKGFFHFMPDTYTVNYLESKNVTYVQGYCFDQYAIDYMSMRGAWQMPYYANPLHVNMPNTLSAKGVVIFPHVTWDWVSSFTVDHQLNTHPLNVYGYMDKNETLATEYIYKLTDNTLKSQHPFGFVSVQAEWDWILKYDTNDMVKEYIKTLLGTRQYKFWSYEDVANWFRENFDYTPDYRLTFVSPYNSEKIEWYYCKEFRVARLDGSEIVSYVDYTEQTEDKFLTTSASVNYSKPASPTNCADNSLTFKIDALGSAPNRHPITTQKLAYTGELSEFRKHHDGSSVIEPSGLPYHRFPSVSQVSNRCSV